MIPSAIDLRVREVSRSQVAGLIVLADETGLSPWSAQNYFDELQTDDSVMLSLTDEAANLVGFIVGRLVPGGTGANPDGEIYNIAVRPGLQGKGYGQKLLDEFLKRCRSGDAATIWLEVRESNQKAIDFYSRNGFEPMQRRVDFYRDPRENGILMRLLLKKDEP